MLYASFVYPLHLATDIMVITLHTVLGNFVVIKVGLK